MRVCFMVALVSLFAIELDDRGCDGIVFVRARWTKTVRTTLWFGLMMPMSQPDADSFGVSWWVMSTDSIGTRFTVTFKVACVRRDWKYRRVTQRDKVWPGVTAHIFAMRWPVDSEERKNEASRLLSWIFDVLSGRQLIVSINESDYWQHTSSLLQQQQLQRPNLSSVYWTSWDDEMSHCHRQFRLPTSCDDKQQ